MAARAAKMSRASTLDTIDHALQRIDSPATESDLQTAGVVGLSQILERDLSARWCGSAAAASGLTGTADRDTMRRVLGDGTLPDGTKIRRKDVTVDSYAVVITAPKSVSLLLASHDDETRAAAQAAQDAAASAYIQTLESLVRTRSGTAGVNSLAAGGLIAARFDHFSSSTGDPHLHTHLLIASTTPGEDGKWRTIDGKTFFAAKRIAEAAGIAAMQKSLEKDLGVGADAWTWREVGSVRTPELTALVDHIDGVSGARRHIADTLSDMGRTLGSASFNEDLTAWRQHRAERGALGEKIEHAVDAALFAGGKDADAVRALWHERAGAGLSESLESVRWGFDLDKAKARSAETIEREALAFVEKSHQWTHADVAAWLVPDCRGDHRAAYRRAAEMIDAWAERGLVTAPRNILSVADAILERREIATEAVHKKAGLHAVCVAEAAVIAEQRLSEKALNLAQQQKERLAVALDKKWSAEQVEAVQKIAAGKGLVSITGVAGAGKTTIAAPIAEAAKAKGLKVVSIARNAARALDTGESVRAHESLSVAAWLDREDKIAQSRQNTLLIIDEAAVIDRDDLQKIMARAERGDIQIVAFGDRKQAQSIDRRGAYSLIDSAARAAGSASVLTKSYRNQAWEREATDLRDGKSGAVRDHAVKEGRISTISESTFALEVARRVSSERGAVAITQTNADAAAISRAVQRELKIDATVKIAQDSWCGVGDRIRTRSNDHRSKVYNGDRWEVSRCNSDGSLIAKNDKGREVYLSAQYCKNAVELDYAATLDSAQGITVPRSITIVRENMGRSQIYSAATRGREAPEYFIFAENIDQAAQKLTKTIETDDIAKTAGEIKAIAVKERDSWAGLEKSLALDGGARHIDSSKSLDQALINTINAEAPAPARAQAQAQKKSFIEQAKEAKERAKNRSKGRGLEYGPGL